MNDNDKLRRLAGITTIVEGGNYTVFDTQVHPEEDPAIDQHEAQAEYNAVRQEAMQGIQQVVDQVASKYGWKPTDILSLAAEDLQRFYNMNKDGE